MGQEAEAGSCRASSGGLQRRSGRPGRASPMPELPPPGRNPGCLHRPCPPCDLPGPRWGRSSAEPGGQQRTAGDNEPRGQRPFGAIDLGCKSAGVSFHTAEATGSCKSHLHDHPPCFEADDGCFCQAGVVRARLAIGPTVRLTAGQDRPGDAAARA
jgi:hypothetical protein